MKKLALILLSFAVSIILVSFTLVLLQGFKVGYFASFVLSALFFIVLAVSACLPFVAGYGWQLTIKGKTYKFNW